jgi:hypothetical protein
MDKALDRLGKIGHGSRSGFAGLDLIDCTAVANTGDAKGVTVNGGAGKDSIKGSAEMARSGGPRQLGTSNHGT